MHSVPRMIYVCKCCGIEFRDKESRKRKFCSRKCYWTNRKGRKQPHSTEIMKKLWKDPEFNKRRREALLRTLRSPERRKIAAESMKKLWRAPEFREKMKKFRDENREVFKNEGKRGIEMHDDAIDDELDKLIKKGNKAIPVGSCKYPRPDIIVVKGDNIKVFALEVEFGEINMDKYDGVKFYDDIIWIQKTKSKGAVEKYV